MKKIYLNLIIIGIAVLIFSCGNSNRGNSFDYGYDYEMEEEKPTGKERVENDGWDYVGTVWGYYDTPADRYTESPKSAGVYLLFYKNGKYIAIDNDYSNLRTEPSRYTVREGNYRIQGESFNARISANSVLVYCNI